MTSDAQVALNFKHNMPRYEAIGIDPNDLRALVNEIPAWKDWCRVWSEAGARHEALAKEAQAKGRHVTAAEAFIRASAYYHVGKHLFANYPDEFGQAHDSMMRCYTAGAAAVDPKIERVEIPYKGVKMAGWLHKSRSGSKAPVAVILPGLDACKEELHAWAKSFVDRGMAALTLDGPGQGETSFLLPTTHEWGPVLGAVIDALEKRGDVDGSRVGVVGQSLGANYAPLAAAGEPRLKACISDCGPYDFGKILPSMPTASQEVFRVRSHAKSMQEAHQLAKSITLENVAERIRCPLLVVFGAGDLLIPPSDGERLAREAKGPTEFVLYEEGNHVCFNISYKFRPLTADWMAEQLRVA